MKKKTGLFKIIAITILAIMLLTWIIPASYFNAGELSDLGMYRVGFFDFFQLLFGSFEFTYFLQVGLLLVSIGALYGVLAKTGKYNAWIEKIASKFNGKEKVFLICTAFVIAAITSTFDFGFSTFIFIPLFISIILCMKYDKITALMATFGAYFVGIIGTTISSNINGTIIETLTDLDTKHALLFQIIMFVAAFALLVLYLIKAKKNSKVEVDAEEVFIGEKQSNKYPVWPIIVIFSLLFLLLALGCIKWSALLPEGKNIFAKLHETITSFNVTINDEEVAIFSVILGNIAALGEWYYAEMAVMCLIAALVIGLCYHQGKEIFTNMYNGAKKILPCALIVMLCYTVVYFAGNTMSYPTIAGWILGATSKFNLFLASIAAILGSALHVDFLYVSTYSLVQVAAGTTNYSLVSLLFQSLYGLTMLVAPTSAMLALGLTYLNIPYKEWIKKTWMFIIELLIVILAILFIVAII